MDTEEAHAGDQTGLGIISRSISRLVGGMLVYQGWTPRCQLSAQGLDQAVCPRPASPRSTSPPTPIARRGTVQMLAMAGLTRCGHPGWTDCQLCETRECTCPRRLQEGGEASNALRCAEKSVIATCAPHVEQIRSVPMIEERLSEIETKNNCRRRRVLYHCTTQLHKYMYSTRLPHQPGASGRFRASGRLTAPPRLAPHPGKL